VTSGSMVAVGVRVGVAGGVKVGVSVAVAVGVRVAVAVGVRVAVAVGVNVAVAVGGRGAVAVGVRVAVAVGVRVAVAVGVGVPVAGAVGVAVAVSSCRTGTPGGPARAAGGGSVVSTSDITIINRRIGSRGRRGIIFLPMIDDLIGRQAGFQFHRGDEKEAGFSSDDRNMRPESG